jgi:hypothetical protein
MSALLCPWVRCLALAAVENLLLRETRELADCVVGGHTIFAAVLLSYCQGDFLPQFRIEAAFGQRSVELHPGFQSRGRIRQARFTLLPDCLMADSCNQIRDWWGS